MSDTIDTTEFRLRERELKLKEDELAHRREMDNRTTRFHLSPWTAALIALLTTAITASISGLWSQRADTAKGQRELALREREQQFQIVLKATENRTPEDAAKNLLFFVDIGYLPDPTGAIRNKAKDKQVPVITTDGRAVNPIEDRVRNRQNQSAGPAVSLQGVPYVIKNHILLTENGDPVSVVSTPNVRRLTEPRFIILHASMTLTAGAVTTWMADSAHRASAHLVVDRDGSVTQMAPFDYATWHAGASAWKGLTGLNNYSIGIELVSTMRTYTDAQIRTTENLIRLLRAAYPSISEILAHSEVSRSTVVHLDPGPAFPLDRVRRETGLTSP